MQGDADCNWSDMNIYGLSVHQRRALGPCWFSSSSPEQFPLFGECSRIVRLPLFFPLSSLPTLGVNTNRRRLSKQQAYLNIQHRLHRVSTLFAVITSGKVLCTAVHKFLGLEEVEAPRICRHSAHEGGKIVSPTHRPPYPPGNTPGTHFC
jgi:hypothetical protein